MDEELKSENTKVESRSEDIDLFEIYKIILQFKPTLITTTILITLIGVIYSLLATPVYKAEVLMLSAQNEQSSSMSALASRAGGLAALAGINLGMTDSNTATSLAILKSRSFTEEFINNEKLMPILFEESWDKENEKWQDEPPSSWDAFFVFSGVRTVSWDIDSGLINLSFEWSDPVLAASIANNLVLSVNEHIRKQAIEETNKSIFFLEEQLKQTSLVNAQTVLFNLIEEQTKNIMLANVREEYAFKVIDYAIAPQQRISPKRKQIVFISLLLGIVLGMIIALGRNYLTNKEPA